MQNNFTFRSILIYHLPMILFAGAIIALSSIPNLSTPKVRWLAVDKVAHFIEYAIFAALTYRSLSHMGQKVNAFKALLLSFLVVAVMAFFDETYQGYIPGRVSDTRDFMTDLLGAFLVFIFLWLRQRKKERRPSPL